MRHRLSQLMDVARDNDRLFDKTRRLVLDLLDAGSLEEVVSAVEDSLRHEFQVPYVSLILFSEATLPVGRCVSTAEAKQNIGGLLEGGKTICGVLRPHELSFLFGEDGPSVGSAAVVSLDDQLGFSPSAAATRSTTRARWAPCSSVISPKCSRASCRASAPRCARYAERSRRRRLARPFFRERGSPVQNELDAYFEYLRSARQLSGHSLDAYRRDLDRFSPTASASASPAGATCRAAICAT